MSTNYLVDSHCHLDFPDYAGQVDAVVARAEAAGVGVCLSIGTELKRFPGVRAVAGRSRPTFVPISLRRARPACR
jgi:Tat protein secretion system quality control protein TatD with DNase activity